MPQCLIAIGSNQGNRQENIRAATQRVGKLPGTGLLATSRLLQTAAVGSPDQIFLNGALLIETSLEPSDLMNHLLEIEATGGRDRRRESGNRPIDLDILLYGQRIVEEENLIVPHPRMSFRQFVMEPAAEIAPHMRHPVLNRTLIQLLRHVRQQPPVIAVLVPESTPPEALESPIRQATGTGNLADSEPLQWVVSADPAEILAAARTRLADPQRWLIVVSHAADSLETLRGAFRLLIQTGRPPREDLSRLAYDGPRWSTGPLPADQLVQNVRTSIQALQPVQPV